MTIREFQAKLERKAKNIKTFAVPLKLAAFSTTAQMGERIFDDGRTTEGTTIGKYDDTPMYVSMLANPKPKGAPTGKPSGKTRKKKVTKFVNEVGTAIETTTIQVAVGGKSKFKDGTPHKSKYFATGYKGYRENVGRQTGYVDLKMTGELRMDFGNSGSVSTPATPRKISEVEYQIRLDKEIDQNKREGLEAKYGDIFTLSETEKKLFYKTIQFEFNNQLSKGK